MPRIVLSPLALVVAALPGWSAMAEESGATVAGRGLSASLGVFGGGHFFAEGTNLGVASAPDASAGAHSNGMLGVRASLGVGRWATIEVEGYGAKTFDRTYDLKATILGCRLNALAYLAPYNFRPFFLVGAGVVSVVSTYADGPEGLVRDTDGEFHVGVGLDYRVLDHLALRADARFVQMPGKPEWSFATDFEVSAGLALTFGAGPRSGWRDAPPEPARPPGPERTPVAATEPAPAVVRTTAPPLPATTATGAAAPAGAATGLARAAPSVRAPRSAGAGRRPAKEGPVPAAGPPAASPAAPKAVSMKELLGRAREIRFEGATSKLSLASLPLLGQLAEALVQEPGLHIEIIGHTASSGDAGKDLGLSRRRAEAVRRALMEREVDGGRLTAIGRGSEEPLAPNVTRNGRRLNERMELRLVAPDGR
jgi:outer membrane protein OmpA-like peptidoglycan-associated protein